MDKKDILWTISIPFRMYNTKELDINTFTFTLSFDAALRKCNVSTARKIISLALEQGWIERDKDLLRAKFELWQPKLFPASWRPTFSNLEKASMIDLIPLDSSIEYKPKKTQIVKKSKPIETEPLFTPKLPEKEADEEKLEEKKEILKEEKKPTAKKKPKKKGQKSIQDFFR